MDLLVKNFALYNPSQGLQYIFPVKKKGNNALGWLTTKITTPAIYKTTTQEGVEKEIVYFFFQREACFFDLSLFKQSSTKSKISRTQAALKKMKSTFPEVQERALEAFLKEVSEDFFIPTIPKGIFTYDKTTGHITPTDIISKKSSLEVFYPYLPEEYQQAQYAEELRTYAAAVYGLACKMDEYLLNKTYLKPLEKTLPKPM